MSSESPAPFFWQVLSSLGLLLAISVGGEALAKPATLVAAAKTTEPIPHPTFTADMPSKTIAGFRMGGAPELEFVFGDINVYKKHIQTFRDIRLNMSKEREVFAKASHSAQRSLDAARKRQRITRKGRACPTKEVAGPYAQATEAGLRFRALGRDFETSYFAIKQLDALGETSGLTPDYRWQVKKSQAQYREALTDLREMRAVFTSQIEAGLRASNCHPQALLSAAAIAQEQKAAAKVKSDETPTPPTSDKTKVAGTANAGAAAVIRASTATFFVDNQACKDVLQVYVDGTLVGQVGAGSKAAFQSLMGRHSLCLLSESSELSCGETGTLRNAFVYDGWAVSRHCE